MEIVREREKKLKDYKTPQKRDFRERERAATRVERETRSRQTKQTGAYFPVVVLGPPVLVSLPLKIEFPFSSPSPPPSLPLPSQVLPARAPRMRAICFVAASGRAQGRR